MNKKKMRERKKKPLEMFFQILLMFVLILVVAIAGLLGFLTVKEYMPDDVETLVVTEGGTSTVKAGDSIRLMTWNIGYGALGESADFFMDGGSMVYSANEDQVKENMEAIRSKVKAIDPDIAFFQEVDINSARSYHMDEASYLHELQGYDSTFANNFKVNFIPYPIPPIGKVDSGILTLSKYEMESSERISLPISFPWPIRMANLKRCLNVVTIPIEGASNNLYLVNLHLEAFDNGEGKIAQTKQLKELLEAAAERGDYVIAGGDFNQTFSDVDKSAYPEIEGTWQPGLLDVSEFNDTFIFAMDNSVPTGRSLDQSLSDAVSIEPSDFQYYLIDGFIVSENITINNLETIDLAFKNSDHNPVVMDITLE